MSIHTHVAVYLGDCAGDSLSIVCDGLCAESDGSTWQRALHALAQPSPRGPYPVSNRFTVFVDETLPEAGADNTVLATYRIDILCDKGFAYATVRTADNVTQLLPVACPIGDDAVTAARRVLEEAGT